MLLIGEVLERASHESTKAVFDLMDNYKWQNEAFMIAALWLTASILAMYLNTLSSKNHMVICIYY